MQIRTYLGIFSVFLSFHVSSVPISEAEAFVKQKLHEGIEQCNSCNYWALMTCYPAEFNLCETLKNVVNILGTVKSQSLKKIPDQYFDKDSITKAASILWKLKQMNNAEITTDQLQKALSLILQTAEQCKKNAPKHLCEQYTATHFFDTLEKL